MTSPRRPGRVTMRRSAALGGLVHADVRPLAMGVAREVAAAMGWSLPYTLGVLTRWKMSAVYCQAVLSHDQRIDLDGSPAETVDAEAKALATKQLAQLAARKAAKKAAEAGRPPW